MKTKKRNFFVVGKARRVHIPGKGYKLVCDNCGSEVSAFKVGIANHAPRYSKFDDIGPKYKYRHYGECNPKNPEYVENRAVIQKDIEWHISFERERDLV